MAIDQTEALKHVPLLAGLGRRDLKRLARHFSEGTFPAGSRVVEEGQEHGLGFFVIAEGSASVSVDGSDVATLGPGDYFGEIALISTRARTATVTAVTDLRCLVISAWDFRAFVQSNAEVSWSLLEHVTLLYDEARSRQSSPKTP